MSQGPCARCEKALDIGRGDTVWFCMECPDIGGATRPAGYTYWLCTGCNQKYRGQDHDFKYRSYPVQHHLGTHKFMDINVASEREGYSELLEMGVPPKNLRIMDSAFEMLKDRGSNQVSVELMAEHLAECHELEIDHPGGAAAAMADCLEIDSIIGLMVDRMDFIKLFIRMTQDYVDANDLFEQFQWFLKNQPKRVIALDATINEAGTHATLMAHGMDGTLLASLSIEEATTVRWVEQQLVVITGTDRHQLKLVQSDGTELEASMRGTARMLDCCRGVKPKHVLTHGRYSRPGATGYCELHADGTYKHTLSNSEVVGTYSLDGPTLQISGTVLWPESSSDEMWHESVDVAKFLAESTILTADLSDPPPAVVRDDPDLDEYESPPNMVVGVPPSDTPSLEVYLQRNASYPMRAHVEEQASDSADVN